MTTNAKSEIVSAIETVVDKKVKDAGFNKTRDGVVEFINPNNTYRIKLDGNIYDNVVTRNVRNVKVGDTVRVHIPNNNPSQMYVESLNNLELLNFFYPVGSIYETTKTKEQFNPNTAWGGTWEQIKGKFLLASSTSYPVGSEGGSADAVVVSHNHSPSETNELFVTTEDGKANNTRVAYSSSGNRYVDGQATQSHFHHRYKTETVGESGVGKNMPPYEVVNIWKRVG